MRDGKKMGDACGASAVEAGSRGSVAVGLGSNLGDRRGHLRRTVERIRERWGLRAVSSVFETEPVVDGPESPSPTGRDFLNLCVVLEEAPAAEQLLRELLALEVVEGRDRRREAGRAGARPVDVDLLLYGERRILSDSLVVPHPRMSRRAFVLVPLAEIAGGWRVPGKGRTVGELADRVPAAGVRRVCRADQLPKATPSAV